LKNFSKTVVIGLFGLAVLALLVWFFVLAGGEWRGRAAQDDIANWQIYKNEELGFEIRYPNYFSVSEDNQNSSVTFKNDSKYVCVPGITLEKKRIEEVEKTIESTYSGPQEEGYYLASMEISTDNYSGKGYHARHPESALVSILALLPRDAETYIFSSCKESNLEEIFSKMLFTFRFIE